MRTRKEQESKNKNRLGILEEDRPNETAKKAFRHKPYQNDFKRRDAGEILPGTAAQKNIGSDATVVRNSKKGRKVSPKQALHQ